MDSTLLKWQDFFVYFDAHPLIKMNYLGTIEVWFICRYDSQTTRCLLYLSIDCTDDVYVEILKFVISRKIKLNNAKKKRLIAKMYYDVTKFNALTWTL